MRITRPFYLGVYEVTQEEYETVMGRNPSCFSAKGGGKDRVAGQDTRRHPVESVSWNDAIAFCNKLSEREGLRPYYRSGAGEQSGGDGYRLPTEAEWEYACRAGSTTRYSFGDDAASLGEFAWYDGNSGSKTHPVGQKRPNAFGLYDMHGNVWEWCWDGYEERYYANSPADDPLGPSQAAGRVIRGGGWTATRATAGRRTGAGSRRTSGTTTWGSASPESSPVVEPGQATSGARSGGRRGGKRAEPPPRRAGAEGEAGQESRASTAN